MLSQLEGVTLELYTTVVLPRILEQASARGAINMMKHKGYSWPYFVPPSIGSWIGRWMNARVSGVALGRFTTEVLTRILERVGALPIARLWRTKAVSGLI